MMKALITSFFLFLTFQLCFAQFQSGKIIYKVEPPENIQGYVDTTGFDEIGKRITFKRFGEIKATTPYLHYTLKFNRNEAVFKRDLQMASDNGLNPNGVARGISSSGIYYWNISENLKLLQFSVPTKTWLVHSKLDGMDWKIGKETKTIKGYLCRKATAPYKLNGIKKLVLTAWFCPALPFQFGPLEAAGLPGLVLALERNNFYFYASEIKLSSKKTNLKRPDKGKVVTEKEYWTEKQEYYNRRRERYRR